MPNRIEYLQTAVHALAETRKAGVPHGCFTISLMALGGEGLHLHDILYRPEEESQQATILSAIERRGFEVIGLFSSDDGKTTETDISEILSFEELLANPSDFAGFMFMLFARAESQMRSHAFVVLPRNGFPHKVRTRLQQNNGHVVLDTELQEGCAEMSPADIATRINLSKRACEVALIGHRKRRKR